MRGRDAIAVALRHPDGEIVYATERLDPASTARAGRSCRSSAGWSSCTRRSSSAPAGSSAAPTSRPRRTGSSSARARSSLMLGLTLAAGVGIFFLLPLFIAVGHDREHRERPRPAPRRGPGPGRDLPRLPVGHRPVAGHPARLPVPRRRAHDDPCPRGRRPADRRRGPQVPDRPPALRHRVPRRRHPAVDHRVLARRPADAAGHDRQPDPAHPGHRRGRLRDPQVRRAAPAEPDRQGRSCTRACSSR